MRWVLAYDVTDNRRRRRVARCLQECGFRRQKSVFEGDFSSKEVELLVQNLGCFLDPETDSMTAWPIISNLIQQIVHTGKPREAAERNWQIL